ncbi:MAG: histidine kinase dimerization/phospho-acceptor domain-containing protein, partial [Solirubrobacteraceae bacterium]
MSAGAAEMSPAAPRAPGLRGRLLLSVLAAIGLTLAALTAGFNLVLDGRLDGDASGVVQARASAELAGLRVDQGRIVLPEAPDDRTPDIQIWVFRGPVALERPRSGAANDGAAAALARGPRATREVARTHTRLYSLPVAQSGRRLGAVVAGVSLLPYEQTARTALVASGVLALVVLIAVGLAARWLISKALRPVARMTLQAATWSDRNLERRFALGAPHDELTQLAFTLDGLLDRLAASLGHEQRLSAELSHELRTPLANIAAQAQFALRHTEQVQDGEDALGQILLSTSRMTRTLDTLIAAARAELDPHRATSDAASGARAAVTACASLGAEQGVEVTVEPGLEPIRVAVEEGVVERILAPLIENACRHAAGRVQIVTDRDGGAARFT